MRIPYDFRKIDYGSIGKYNVYVFDGPHGYQDQFVEDVLRNVGDAQVFYISRTNTGQRQISNETALVEAIRTALPDCHIVHLEKMSFAEQVTLFRDAEIIISPHGGGLTNSNISGL